MENKREMNIRLSSGSELQSFDTSDRESFANMSILDGIESMESSFDGVFDGSVIPSVHEVKETENVALRNAVARSDKRFETAMGLNSVKTNGLLFKPVSSPHKMVIAS